MRLEAGGWLERAERTPSATRLGRVAHSVLRAFARKRSNKAGYAPTRMHAILLVESLLQAVAVLEFLPMPGYLAGVSGRGGMAQCKRLRKDQPQVQLTLPSKL